MPISTKYGEQPGLDVAIGPVVQQLVPPGVHGLAGPISASGNVVSNLLVSAGYKILAVGATSTQAGQIQVQRYLDPAGQVKQGAAVTGSLTANTAAVVNVDDGLPFTSYTVTITNSSGSQATLSNVVILQQAQ